MANDIKKYPVPLIFKKIEKDKLSGVLEVTHRYFTKKLLFVNAYLVSAGSSLESERLGEMLCASGKITAARLQETLDLQKKTTPHRKIGEILVKTTDLSMTDIYNALLSQVKTIAVSTFSLDDGQWKFTVATPDNKDNSTLKIRLPEVIHDGVPKIKDFSYFIKRFYYRCPVTTTLPQPLLKYLSPGKVRFYTQLQEFANIPVEKLIKAAKIPENKFWKRLALFYLLNTLDFVEFTVDEAVNENVEDINDLYEKVNAGKLDHYHLLDLEPTASKEQIKDRYFDYSKKYHPDRINAAPDSTVMVKANAVFAEINKAYETLGNQDKKKEYDVKDYRPAAQPHAQAVGRGIKAKDLYLKANRLYKQKQYYEAAALMEEAVQSEPSKANYFLLLGLAQAKLAPYKKKAEESLKKASQLEPWNADPLFALGELYRAEGLVKKAEEYYQKALDINMEHTLAGKAVQDMERFFGKKKSLFSLFGKKSQK